MLKLIDSHCHLDFEIFDSDRAEMLVRAKQHGIEAMVIPGISSQQWASVKTLCNTHEQLHPCYGLHPYFFDQHKDEDLATLDNWLGQHPCVALGECGLDYRKGQADKKIQKMFLEAQLDIAITHQLPVVIHSVHATEDVIKSLRQRPELKGMIHSYSGSYEQAMQLIELGFYISLGGQLTYDRAHKLRSAAAKIPLDKLLLETDSPDQPDTDHQGERNEPAYLINVLDCLSELRTENQEEIADQTTNNARALFNI